MTFALLPAGQEKARKMRILTYHKPFDGLWRIMHNHARNYHDPASEDKT